MHLSSLAPGANPNTADVLGGQVSSRTQLAFAQPGPQPTSLYNGMSDAKIMWRIVMGGDFSALAEANRRGMTIAANDAAKLRSKIAAVIKSGNAPAQWIQQAVNNMRVEAQNIVEQRAKNIKTRNTARKQILLQQRMPNYQYSDNAAAQARKNLLEQALQNVSDPIINRAKPVYAPPTYTPLSYAATIAPILRDPAALPAQITDTAPDPVTPVTPVTSSFVVPGTGSGGGMLTPYNDFSDFSDFDKSAHSVQETIESPTNWPLIIGGGVGAIALLLVLTRKKSA